MKLETIEDYLECLCGFVLDDKFKFSIDKSDYNLVTSLGRQSFKGLAFTDRQYNLLKEKLFSYKEQFENNNIDGLEESFNNLRLPLREIDRRKTIEIIKEDDSLFIKVKFPFNKKLIDLIEILRQIPGARYNKETKVHVIPYNEQLFFKVFDYVKDRNFTFDERLEKLYKDLLEMKNNKENHVPGVYGFKLKNLNEKAFEYAISSIGEPNEKNLPIYADRKEQIGLHHFDEEDLTLSLDKLTTLSKLIVKRNKTNVLINSNKFSLEDIAGSILELHRFPILVILNEDPLDGMLKVHKLFEGIFANDSFSVMFRLDNKDEYAKSFNQAVKEYNLNNKLDINSKVVYINNDKLPKTILTTEFKPQSVLLINSKRVHSKFEAYLNNFDLIMHYDTDASPFVSKDIEKL